MKLEVIELSVRPTTFVISKLWVNNARCSDGGYFKLSKVKFPNGKLSVSFKANVDMDLTLFVVYESQSGARFRAVDTNTIVNLDTIMDTFELPTELVPISSLISESGYYEVKTFAPEQNI